MNLRKLATALLLISLVMLIAAPGYTQKLKIAYIHSAKLLSELKDAKDVQKKIDEIDRQWKQEGLEMQQQAQKLNEQYESQSLLLSEAKKKEKEQEIQNLMLKLQQFQQVKYGPQTGEIYKKQAEFMQPVYDKINEAIKKVGDIEKYDLILDTAAGNILHASDAIKDITDRVLEELTKGETVKKN